MWLSSLSSSLSLPRLRQRLIETRGTRRMSSGRAGTGLIALGRNKVPGRVKIGR